MNKTYKVDFLTRISDKEEIEIMRNLIITGGTKWLYNILHQMNVSGRTKIVDTFRIGARRGHWFNGTWIPYPAPGRTRIDQENSINILLQNAPSEYWIGQFLKRYSVDIVSNCIEQGFKDAQTPTSTSYSKKFNYNIEIELEIDQ